MYVHATARIYHSDDGYVWTAYGSQQPDTDLGRVFERQATTTTVQFDPHIRVRIQLKL